jgi:hypothetical protein
MHRVQVTAGMVNLGSGPPTGDNAEPSAQLRAKVCLGSGRVGGCGDRDDLVWAGPEHDDVHDDTSGFQIADVEVEVAFAAVADREPARPPPWRRRAWRRLPPRPTRTGRTVRRHPVDVHPVDVHPVAAPHSGHGDPPVRGVADPTGHCRIRRWSFQASAEGRTRGHYWDSWLRSRRVQPSAVSSHEQLTPSRTRFAIRNHEVLVAHPLILPLRQIRLVPLRGRHPAEPPGGLDPAGQCSSTVGPRGRLACARLSASREETSWASRYDPPLHNGGPTSPPFLKVGGARMPAGASDSAGTAQLTTKAHSTSR